MRTVFLASCFYHFRLQVLYELEYSDNEAINLSGDYTMQSITYKTRLKSFLSIVFERNTGKTSTVESRLVVLHGAVPFLSLVLKFSSCLTRRSRVSESANRK